MSELVPPIKRQVYNISHRVFFVKDNAYLDGVSFEE
jgi:hypothetical protein